MLSSTSQTPRLILVSRVTSTLCCRPRQQSLPTPHPVRARRYVVAEDNGIIRINLNDVTKRGYVYIKDNNVAHANPFFSKRAFGGLRTAGSTIAGYPLLEIAGAPLRRTWSLLAETVEAGATTVQVLHDGAAMGKGELGPHAPYRAPHAMHRTWACRHTHAHAPTYPRIALCHGRTTRCGTGRLHNCPVCVRY